MQPRSDQYFLRAKTVSWKVGFKDGVGVTGPPSGGRAGGGSGVSRWRSATSFFGLVQIGCEGTGSQGFRVRVVLLLMIRQEGGGAEARASQRLRAVYLKHGVFIKPRNEPRVHRPPLARVASPLRASGPRRSPLWCSLLRASRHISRVLVPWSCKCRNR